MSERRHLMVLTTDFKPMTGGVAEFLHQLAHQAAKEFPVSVLTTVPQNGCAWDHAYRLSTLNPLPERRLGRRAGDGFTPIRKLHTAAYFLALSRHGACTFALAKSLAGADVAAMIGIWDTAAHFWCEAWQRAGAPYYLMAHGAELLQPLYGRLPRWRAGDFARAARVVANSRATAELATQLFELRRPPAVLNPVIGERPPAEQLARCEARLRPTLLREHGGPIVLTVGRLVPRKGCDLVLRSIAELSGEYPGLTYVIAGDGPERGRLDALASALDIAPRVRFLGSVDELVKWTLYQMCDVFVLPNRLLGGRDWEGFGIVFLEAALAGRPAIGGRTGGTADAIVDGETGVLVDPEQGGALTAAIRRLLSDPILRDRLGRAAATRARTQFAGEHMAARLSSALGWIDPRHGEKQACCRT